MNLMNNIESNFEKIIPNNQDTDENLFSKKSENKNNFKNTQKIVDNKKIILDTIVDLSVELGRSKIKIKDFLSLSKGSMLILDKLIKEPLDIFINGHLIASGEIVVLEEKYGLRITRIKNSLETINISS
ncbi:flagellar motor switch protein FliN [Buchnera aphidicola (Artemisaphis artemisicola)]|uniref:Flagellar motor switch protein FliN n=2 Tax=Buchnera aphidicola TaxID=9 RepID=A0A4D6XI30_9GAMM|nr:flagellar motor switch protein FliN [Buchnera aphidicola (Artemisaphis artemisicola)]